MTDKVKKGYITKIRFGAICRLQKKEGRSSRIIPLAKIFKLCELTF